MTKPDKSDLVAGVGLVSLLGGIAHFSVAIAAIVAGCLFIFYGYVMAK